ncbi:MAG: hypothetical protein AAFQ63_21680 [Cyanobacteria bacterium J06621_11]
MSLSVSPYVRTSEGTLKWLPVRPEFNDLAGTENTCWTFWGSPEVKHLGLSLLPTLSKTDIYAEEASLDLVEREVNILLLQLVNFCDRAKQEYWHFRLMNIAEAIRVAKENNGGIYIG